MTEIPYIDQLVAVSLLQEHLDSITQAIGIPVYILKNDGNYILGKQYNYGQICGFLKYKLEKCKQCKLRALDTTVSAILSSKDDFIVYGCLPMIEIFGSPITIDKKTIAVILAEKKKSLDLNISQLQEYAQESGLDSETTNAFIENILIIPVVSSVEKVQSAQKLIAVMANVISQLAGKEFSLRHSIEQMKTVNDIVVALNQYKDIDSIIQFIVDQVIDLTKARDGALFLWDGSRRTMVTYNKKDINYCKVPVRRGIINKALNKREAQRIDNVHNDPDYVEILPSIQSELAVPLILENIPIGVLDVQSDQLNHFTEEHEYIMVMLAKHVTAALLSTFVTQFMASIENEYLIEELQKSAANKDELIRDLAHELKTPLTHIITFLEHLVNRSISISDKEREFAKIAHQEMWRYVRLVDKILTFSRILGKRLILSKEPLILSDVLKTSIDFYTPIAKHKDIELQLQGNVKDAKIVADKDSLIQIFVNLLDNAIKYTPNGGVVQVSLEEQNSLYRIKVSDNGIGISEIALQHLFEPYRSGDDARPGQKGGLGIGLYIVKQLVEEHQGSITVESRLNEGTTFTFDLPKKEVS